MPIKKMASVYTYMGTESQNKEGSLLCNNPDNLWFTISTITNLKHTHTHMAISTQAVFNWVYLARGQLGKLKDDIEYNFGASELAAAVAPSTSAHAAPGCKPPEPQPSS